MWWSRDEPNVVQGLLIGACERICLCVCVRVCVRVCVCVIERERESEGTHYDPEFRQLRRNKQLSWQVVFLKRDLENGLIIFK